MSAPVNLPDTAETSAVKMSLDSAKKKLTDAVEQINTIGERVVLTRNSKGVAALVSMDDLAALERLENEADLNAAGRTLKEKRRRTPLAEMKRQSEDESDIRAARKARKEKGGITLDEYCKKHGL